LRQAYATGRINQISIPPVLLGEVGGAPGAGAGPLPSGRQQAMQKCLCFAPACSLVALRLECKKPEEEPLQSGSFWIALGTRASEHATASLGQHHPLRGAPLKSLRRRGRAPPCYAPISGSPLWFFSEAALELYKDPWKGLLHLRRPRCLDQNTPYRRKVRGAGGRECHTPVRTPGTSPAPTGVGFFQARAGSSWALAEPLRAGHQGRPVTVPGGAERH
jgi:hypothetical protein